MKDPKNYKLIYDVRRAGVSTSSEHNLIATYQFRARTEALKEHQKYIDLLTQLLGHKDFEITNIACMADGIAGHVYSPVEGVPDGVGKKVCVFCGCDDFDGY
jgi:hypothetical protein